MILGILSSGRNDPNYIEEVRLQVGSLQGEKARSAKEKFVAVCAITGSHQAIGRGQELDMWIDEVKDSPLIQRIVEIAGKDGIDEEGRRQAALHRVIDYCACKHALFRIPRMRPKHSWPPIASQESLFGMVDDLPAIWKTSPSSSKDTASACRAHTV